MTMPIYVFLQPHKSPPRHNSATNAPAAIVPRLKGTSRRGDFGCFNLYYIILCLIYALEQGGEQTFIRRKKTGRGWGLSGGGSGGQPHPSRPGRHRGWKREAERCFIIRLQSVIQCIDFFSWGYVDNSFPDITKVLCTLAV